MKRLGSTTSLTGSRSFSSSSMTFRPLSVSMIFDKSLGVNKASRESMKRRRAEATEAAKAYTGKEYKPEEVYYPYIVLNFSQQDPQL